MIIDLDDLKEQLADRNISELARRTGLDYRRVRDFIKGRRDDIKASEYIRLQDYLKENSNE